VRGDSATIELAGHRLALTRLRKVFYPATGTTKSDVIAYFAEVAHAMIPHLAGRPVTRKRWPDGVNTTPFFHKDIGKGVPSWVTRRVIQHSDGPKAYPVVKLVAWSRGKADRKEAEALAVAPGDAVIRVRNLLELDGHPIIVDDIAIAAARFPGLTERQFRERPSTIYSLYEDAFGLSVVRARERLRAATADAEIAPLLAVPRGTPLLAIRRIAHTLAGDPIELRLSRVNTAKHEYFADIDGGA